MGDFCHCTDCHEADYNLFANSKRFCDIRDVLPAFPSVFFLFSQGFRHFPAKACLVN
jgi:hypothetical protein